MQALTKKHPTRTTKRVHLSFTGPASRYARAVAGLAKLGFTLEDQNAGDSIPWQDVFPEVRGNVPGTVLSGARTKAGLTQVELARQAKIPQRHISEMEHGKRAIGKDRARRLAEVLNIPYQSLL